MQKNKWSAKINGETRVFYYCCWLVCNETCTENDNKVHLIKIHYWKKLFEKNRFNLWKQSFYFFLVYDFNKQIAREKNCVCVERKTQF